MLKILDLFCGAGGAAVGYSYFPNCEITGIDINPQPNYPFKFIQADALQPPVQLADYDFIHASPPCQGYSITREMNKGHNLVTYPRLIPQVHQLLLTANRPYVIENVVGAPLVDPIMLCGAYFDLPIYRHRLFESNLSLEQLEHTPHSQLSFKTVEVQGHDFRMKDAVDALQIDWMRSIDEIREAIPPAYTKYLAFQLFPQIIAQHTAVPA